MRFSPAIQPTLIRLVDELDDGSAGIAALWRTLGRLARHRGLLQPSYESIRRLVHTQRAARRLQTLRARRAAIVLTDKLFRTRDPARVMLAVLARQELYKRGAPRRRVRGDP